jgi:ParB family chromosome partitioning protein
VASINRISRDSLDEERLKKRPGWQIEALEAERAALDNRAPVYDPEQKARALAWVLIGEDGQPTIEEALFMAPSDDDGADAPRGGDDDEGGDPADYGAHAGGGYAGDNAGAGEPGYDNEDDEPHKAALSQRLVDRLAVMRTELVALHVASDPHFAMDLGAFIMADGSQRRFGAHDLASDLRADLPENRVGNFVSETAAAGAWAKLEGELDRSWCDAADAAERFEAFRVLPDEARAGWFAWAIARTIAPVTDTSQGAPFLRHVGRSLGIDVARWWRPTARNFFDGVTRGWLLDLIGEVGGEDLKSRYGATRKADLSTSAEKLFSGQTIVEAGLKDRLLAWLPQPMRLDEAQDGAGAAFNVEPDTATGDGDASDLAEAA